MQRGIEGFLSIAGALAVLALSFVLVAVAPGDWRTAVLLFLFAGLAMGHAMRDGPPDSPPPAGPAAVPTSILVLPGTKDPATGGYLWRIEDVKQKG